MTGVGGPARQSAGRDRSSGERGESLIELLISVSILGLAAAGFLGSLILIAGISYFHGNESKAQNILRNWAEAVSESAYLACPDQTVAAPPAGIGADWVVSSTKQVWSPSATDGQPCGSASDVGTQLVTLSVTAPSSAYPGFTRELKIVKRNPCDSSKPVCQ